MPHIAVSWYAGRDEETKQDIAEKVGNFFTSELGFPAESVTVSIVDIPSEEFVDTIKKRYRADQLYVSSEAIPADYT
jgi:4-oxalocrotonate tautomerase